MKNRVLGDDSERALGGDLEAETAGNAGLARGAVARRLSIWVRWSQRHEARKGEGIRGLGRLNALEAKAPSDSDRRLRRAAT